MSILTGKVGEVFAAATGAILEGLDGLLTSDDERNAAAVLVQKEMNAANARVMEHVEAEDRERTKRHEHDMQSDSWLSKNIRPLALAYTTIMMTMFMALDSAAPQCVADDSGQLPGWCFSVSADWIKLFGGLLMLVYGFYFGSRGLEKIAKMFSTNRPSLK